MRFSARSVHGSFRKRARLRWQGSEVGPVFFDGANYKTELSRHTVKDTPKRSDPFLGDRELLLVANSERFVQGNAENSVETFEFASGGAEKLGHFLRKAGKPILAHAA